MEHFGTPGTRFGRTDDTARTLGPGSVAVRGGAMTSGARSGGGPGRVATSARGLPRARSFPWLVALASIVLASPSLSAGWILDDYFHRTVLLGHSQYRELLGSPSEMFRFFRGDPVRTGRLM